MDLEFTSPRADLEAPFMAMVREFRDAGERRFEGEPGLDADDFATYLAWLQDGEHGLAHDDWLGGELVPWSSYWLVERGTGAVLGVSSLRHRLNARLEHRGGHIGYAIRPSARGRGLATQILRRTLGQARERNLERVLLVCAASNLASARVIEKCGGQLENQIPIEIGVGEEARQVLLSRYWIGLGASDAST